ncbi:monovalent cation/H+ antiporter complex subunit F [Brumicola pallidula]|jgi:multicomponent Na+:H+ antiporter subunit F|uniref:Multiple resistance and pH regulation protein F n=1 Tax=Brumicola pallidula DSM 14239 = ACAM 615 TaxID=1121922 RepID=K7A1W5_9ALTE|nr:monovalent cation/H+ antiporter complex subunit F [Glaciecola pallidula]GAC29510.1 multiple resistance and pH regulation protein F [Glaciecola pallidula DSM 14239 = ACAM 615]
MILYLTIIAMLLTLTLLVGLIRVIIGPSESDRMLACQLFGTAGVALTIILAVVQQQATLLNLALVLALLAPLTLIVFVKNTRKSK